MRIAVIGTGKIGSTLGGKWLAAGHEVIYGARSAGQPGPGGAPTETVADAVASADVVVFAVPGPAVAEVAAALGSGLAGKVVIDAANRMGQSEVNSHAAITAAAPDARYVRAFNTLGWENFATPTFAHGERADLFFAGPDGPTRGSVERLIADVGLRPVWVGGADQVETVDGVTRLWFALVMGRHMPRHTAFRVLADS